MTTQDNHTGDSVADDRVAREKKREQLEYGAELIVGHDADDGTVVDGTSQGSPAIPVLKEHGFRWSRNLGMWYLPKSRDRSSDRGAIDRVCTALEDAGFTVSTRIDDTIISAAERERRRAARAEDRADYLAARASMKAEAADAAEAAFCEAVRQTPPGGEPVHVGHHSERRHRASIARADRALGKAVEARQEAKRADWRAQQAKAAPGARTNPVTVANRIKKMEAELRKLRRSGSSEDRDRQAAELAETIEYWQGVRAQQIRDGDAVDPADIRVGDLVRINGSVYPVLKVNQKTLKVPHPLNPAVPFSVKKHEVTAVRHPDH